MFEFFRKRQTADNAIVAVADGEMIAIDTVNDPVFSKKMMGDGVAFTLKSGMIVSPSSGTLTMLYPTGHAFGVGRDDGVELLVHIGIDTVNLEGKGFTLLKKQGDKVKAGEPVIRVDYEQLRQSGYDLTTMLIVTADNHKAITFAEPQQVFAGQTIA